MMMTPETSPRATESNVVATQFEIITVPIVWELVLEIANHIQNTWNVPAVAFKRSANEIDTFSLKAQICFYLFLSINHGWHL